MTITELQLGLSFDSTVIGLIINPMVVVPDGFDPFDPEHEVQLDATMVDVINGIKGRRVEVVTPTLEQFAASKGFNLNVHQDLLLNTLCGTAFKGCGNFTTSRSNKLANTKNRLAKSGATLAKLAKEYEELESAGGVTREHKYEPLNLSWKADRALVRIHVRRAARNETRQRSAA